MIKKTLLILTLAATAATISAKESFKKAEAEVKIFKVFDKQHGEFTLDFINNFYSGREEYERYSKSGYPKLTWKEYNEKKAGADSFTMNDNPKLRKFTTNADTIYGAQCVMSPHITKNSYVSLSLTEFTDFLRYAFGNESKEVKSALSAIYDKHGNCNSLYSKWVIIEYEGTLLKSISFDWMP